MSFHRKSVLLSLQHFGAAFEGCWPSRDSVGGQFEKIIPTGAKARIHFARFMYGLKPVPFKQTHYRKFRLRVAAATPLTG
jgi:hypothetical protein